VKRYFCSVALSLIATRFAEASVMFNSYGDDNGFEIGVTTGNIDPAVAFGGAGDHANTDVGLIGNGFLPLSFATDGVDKVIVAIRESVTWAVGPGGMGGLGNINPVDGANAIDVNAEGIPEPAVPEPGTNSLVGVALVGLAGFVHRLRKPSTSRI
jgi:hypothetical protein